MWLPVDDLRLRGRPAHRPAEPLAALRVLEVVVQVRGAPGHLERRPPPDVAVVAYEGHGVREAPLVGPGAPRRIPVGVLGHGLGERPLRGSQVVLHALSPFQFLRRPGLGNVAIRPAVVVAVAVVERVVEGLPGHRAAGGRALTKQLFANGMREGPPRRAFLQDS